MPANPVLPLRARVSGFVALTKPRIIELLLVTTVPTMFVARQGVPSVWLMVATVLGGTLAAGGANAVNMVVDRDIDSLMEGSLSDGRLSMKLFSTTGYNAINPLLTFRCLSNMPAFHISVNFDLQGPYFVTYPGIGQFYQALELARAALASGEVNIALVGAVAAQRNFLVEHHHARLSPPVAADTLADVAGCLVLETESHARKRGGTVRGRLEKHALAYNPFDPFKQPPEFYEQFDNGEHPPGELGPASLAVALGLNPSTTLRHEAQTRDGFRVNSQWELA